MSYNVNVKKILLDHGIDAAFLSSGTTSMLYFSDPSQIDRAFTELGGYPQLDIVRRSAQPADWHLGISARVGDLIISAKPPYFIEDSERWPAWSRWLATWGPEFLWAGIAVKASHGYPPDTPGMHGILYAWGAGIAQGHEVETVRAIDIHPTVMRLLGISQGNPVDGRVADGLLATP